jgi:hypothetical protein
MSRGSLGLLLALLISTSRPALAQSTTTATPTPTRDPQALQIVAQAVNTAGITVAFQFQDLTGSGAITYHWAGKDVAGTVLLRCKGTNEARLDATLPNGTRSWIINDGQGTIMQLDGTTTVIPLSITANLGLIAAPDLVLSALLTDPTTGVSLIGEQRFNGKTAFQIRVNENFTNWDPASQNAPWAIKDYFIDASTYLVIATQTTGFDADWPTHKFSYEIDYDGYQQVSGILMPFSVTERVGGQATWTATLSSINFNTGLTDSVFQF